MIPKNCPICNREIEGSTTDSYYCPKLVAGDYYHYSLVFVNGKLDLIHLIQKQLQVSIDFGMNKSRVSEIISDYNLKHLWTFDKSFEINHLSLDSIQEVFNKLKLYMVFS